ncbi:CHRD domain-containing protein [Candidatus Gottesmanbacteria bacterium]|nr:CHRD domain-containing protein [Candidatus Gottesmanbacteria bacterium]
MAEENYSKSFFTPKNILIYLIVGGIIYALVYYFVLAPKGGYSSQTNYPATTPTSQTETPKMMSSMTVALSALGSSGETGTAILSEERGKAKVVISVTGEPAGAIQPAHIHIGACPTPGKVLYSLTNVVAGTSETTIAASLADLKAQLPLAINLHESAAMIKKYVACGDLK